MLVFPTPVAHDIRYWAAARGYAMTPEEALRNILRLVDDEMDNIHALQILLQSIKTLAEKGLGRSE